MRVRIPLFIEQLPFTISPYGFPIYNGCVAYYAMDVPYSEAMLSGCGREVKPSVGKMLRGIGALPPRRRSPDRHAVPFAISFEICSPTG
jgi:hypothetical protein